MISLISLMFALWGLYLRIARAQAEWRDAVFNDKPNGHPHGRGIANRGQASVGGPIGGGQPIPYQHDQEMRQTEPEEYILERGPPKRGSVSKSLGPDDLESADTVVGHDERLARRESYVAMLLIRADLAGRHMMANIP